jgi:hypothetical protein
VTQADPPSAPAAPAGGEFAPDAAASTEPAERPQPQPERQAAPEHDSASGGGEFAP